MQMSVREQGLVDRMDNESGAGRHCSGFGDAKEDNRRSRSVGLPRLSNQLMGWDVRRRTC